jgi:hypothetical protein
MRSCSQSNISTSKTQFNFIRICDTLFILKICILNLSKIYMHRPNIRSVSDSGPYRNTTGELGFTWLAFLVMARRCCWQADSPAVSFSRRHQQHPAHETFSLFFRLSFSSRKGDRLDRRGRPAGPSPFILRCRVIALENILIPSCSCSCLPA